MEFQDLSFYMPFIGVISYIFLFLAVGFVFARSYMKENLLIAMKEQLRDDKFSIDLAIKHVERNEEISYVLCGFAIISLVFIITQFQTSLASVEIIIGLFSLAFICEIFSAFLYHNLSPNAYAYGGMVFQYGGLFAIMLGFWSYLGTFMEWSLIMQLVYIFGIVVFGVLTAKEINIITNYSQELKKDD